MKLSQNGASWLARLAAVASLAMTVHSTSPANGGEPIRVTTHQSYVEDSLRRTELRTNDPMAVFAAVFDSLSARVKVYPTENYYYFSFLADGVRYSGNIRLDAKDRDAGKAHFAFFEDMAEWREEPPTVYQLLDAKVGVTVEKLEPLLYRISYRGKAVEFELNDLSGVRPPPGMIGPDEVYIGPIFDDSAIRFFLIYNSRLKIFHYVLDETDRMADGFLWTHVTDRILIGKRTGFAYYDEPRRHRKILIGVFEGNARVNNAFDGPFDQLPDNFIEGDTLRRAIISADPEIAGKIDRFGGLINGTGRYIIAPYTYYRTEEDLLPFHRCAIDARVPVDLYDACFAMDWGEPRQIAAVGRIEPPTGKHRKAPRISRKNSAR